MGDAADYYLPEVAGVAVVSDHVLRLLFSDGTAVNGFYLALAQNMTPTP